jgi:hypothetical protein
LSDHPNILGGCLAFGLVLLAAWYLDRSSQESEVRAYLNSPDGSKEDTRLQASPVIVATFALGCAGLLLTFSRSAWLALICGLGFY